MQKSVWAVVPAIAFIVGSAAAQDATAILKYAINTPGVSYTAYGPTQTARVVNDDKVQGGQAYRVEVNAKGPNPYTSGATAPLVKAIAKGDRFVIAFWARAPKVAEGKTTPIPFAGLQQSGTPYTQFVFGSADLEREWKMFEVRGVADKDYPAGEANVALHLAAEKTTIVALHLAAEKTTIDLGPLFVLDLGPKK